MIRHTVIPLNCGCQLKFFKKGDEPARRHGDRDDEIRKASKKKYPNWEKYIDVDLLKYLGSGKCGASPMPLLASRSMGSVAPAFLAESSLRAAALAKASQTAVAKTDETFMIETRESPEMPCRADDQLDRRRKRDVGMSSGCSPSRQSQGRNCAAMRFDLQWIQGFTVEYVTPLSTRRFDNVPKGERRVSWMAEEPS